MTADAPGKPGEPVCRRLLEPREARGVPVEWIWYLNTTGELPIYHLPGGRRIDEAELARVVTAHQAGRR